MSGHGNTTPDWEAMHRFIQRLDQKKLSEGLTELDQLIEKQRKERQHVRKLTNPELASALKIIWLDIPEGHDVLISEIVRRLEGS